jgi:hypothetical protein
VLRRSYDQGHPKQAEVEADLMATYSKRPGLAMVDSNKVSKPFFLKIRPVTRLFAYNVYFVITVIRYCKICTLSTILLHKMGEASETAGVPLLI